MTETPTYCRQQLAKAKSAVRKLKRDRYAVRIDEESYKIALEEKQAAVKAWTRKMWEHAQAKAGNPVVDEAAQVHAMLDYIATGEHVHPAARKPVIPRRGHRKFRNFDSRRPHGW